MRAECGNISRNVGRATRPLFDTLHFKHRHWSFWRNAINVAKQ